MTPRYLSSNDATPTAVQMRQLVADLIDESPMPTPWDDIGTDAVSSARDLQPHRRRPVLVGAIAASMVGLLIVGLVAMNRSQPSDTASQETVSPGSGALADADDLSSSEWVVIGAPSAEMSYQYSMVGSVLDGSRRTVYGSSNEGSGLTIVVGPHVETLVGETIIVDGRTWFVSDTDGGWTAAREVGSTTVSVSGFGQFDTDARTVLGKLSVVAQVDLPFAPLGVDSELVDVAVYQVDGTVLTLAAQEANGYYCIWTLDADGRGGSCGYRFDPAEVVSPADLVVGVNAPNGASSAQVHAGGIVSADVARVEVEFANGETVSVNPTDLSGQLDTRFWIAAIAVPYSDEDSLAGFDRRVLEVRAYNSSDELIATA